MSDKNQGLNPTDQRQWDHSMQLLDAMLDASAHAKRLQAISWAELDATTILTNHRPLCWCAIGSGLALDTDELQNLKQQVIDLALEWIRIGKLSSVITFLEMARMQSWRDQIAAEALSTLNPSLGDPSAKQGFCMLVGDIGQTSAMCWDRPLTQKALRQITQEHLVEANLTLDNKITLLQHVGGEVSLRLLQRTADVCSLENMQALWNSLCHEHEAPIASENEELAQRAVDLLNKHFNTHVFTSSW